MKIGLITDSVSHLPFTEVLDLAQRLGLSSVEVATGNWSTAPHADLAALVRSSAAREEFLGQIAARDVTLSALNANGNQLHPVTGPEHDRVVRDTIRAAAAMDVPTVVLMSGLPGGGPDDRTSNWITTAWPPENITALTYQWEQVALPYWTELAAFARDHGVRLAVEACGSQLVHTVSSLQRLIDHAGSDVVGANLDPSHLMWMGADIPSVIRALGPSIFHVHAKDVRINPWAAATDGLLDTVPITTPHRRAWNYVTLGLGHADGSSFWADFVYQLRAVGYEGTLNIEHEDALVSAAEGVTRAATLLKDVLLVDAPDWTPAAI
ncbi:sugar phosphate isomerase/epimerase family protein [Nakamurella deserti]|uniref:sugar phosphate isomerase/epimerase family protein n=1 Tax=Nakamurella deserti TaxID=2164074 RepID=UPI000DBEA439|nr:sugar phosphate isomerase/epimerase [Nakamurella deserti]